MRGARGSTGPRTEKNLDATTLVTFLGGLALLVLGAEALVRGASRVALAAGISPLVIGLTVVAYGTSAPEMAISVKSALQGDAGADLALGNVVGSNIFNVLFILGVSASIAPLVVHRQLVRLDVPIMIGASLLVLPIALDGRIQRIEGAGLVAVAIAYTGFLVWLGRREGKAAIQQDGVAVPDAATMAAGSWILNAGLVVAGLGLLVLGARWLVDASIEFARLLGISELVIGLTIVSAGTSLPEVSTSIIATLRGERDIAVGNVVGSNIFNVLAVLGLASLVSPTGVGVAPAALNFDIPVMIAVAVACLPIFFRSHRISRWEGLLFLAYYVAYATYLVLASQQHDALPRFSAVMLEFVLPITAVTITVLAVRASNRRRAARVRS